MTAKNASYLYESWSQNYLLPFPRTITAKEITEFFSELGSCPAWEKTFFGARFRRMGEDEIFSYDATNIATKACEITDAQYGKSKDGGYRRQIGMSVLCGHNSKIAGNVPSLSRQYCRCQHSGQSADASRFDCRSKSDYRRSRSRLLFVGQSCQMCGCWTQGFNFGENGRRQGEGSRRTGYGRFVGCSNTTSRLYDLGQDGAKADEVCRRKVAYAVGTRVP